LAESFGAERFTSLTVASTKGDQKIMVGQQADRQTAVLFPGIDLANDHTKRLEYPPTTVPC
jgi:hypothetical protein